MTRFVALLRAVNVGGTGKLLMADLRAMCVDIGFDDVKTYIASGNVVFASDLSALNVKAALEARLAEYAGDVIPVFVRDAQEMVLVAASNPFPDASGNQAVVIFLDAPPAADALAYADRVNGEEMRLGLREIYVNYVNGQSGSKLRIPAAAAGTARNMNTVRKLAKMVAG